jgi:hypothetical protein
MTWQQLFSLSTGEREKAFIESFQAMCRKLHQNITESDEARDACRLNESSYLSISSVLSGFRKGMLHTLLGKRKKI